MAGKKNRAKKNAANEEQAEIPLTCPVDAAALDYRGYCELGRGFPDSMRCPFVCPKCRKRLSWSGACFSCFGTDTGSREDWTMPGDRYDLIGRHWILASGPLPVVSVEDHAVLMANCREMVSGAISAEQGRLRAQVILAKYPDNPAPSGGVVPF